MVLTIVAGLALLLLGGEALVRGGARLALRLGLSPAVIGLTVIGFGTSTPELVTSLKAALAGSPGIALGNVIGSNIANILLILGVAALVLPFVASARALRLDLAILALASVLAAGFVALGEIGRVPGIILLAGLAVYSVLSLRLGKVDAPEAETLGAGSAWLAFAITAVGIAMTVSGASLLVDGALVLARDFGLSEAVIGLTLVAVGTSLPELAASVIAALRGQSAMALGNVIGSNIFNVLGILGITAVIAPLGVPEGIGAFDIGVLLASAAALIGLLILERVSRVAGALLILGYCGYIAVLGQSLSA